MNTDSLTIFNLVRFSIWREDCKPVKRLGWRSRWLAWGFSQISGGSVNNGLRSVVLFLSIALAFLALTAPTPISAQVISGDVVGTVLDKTGATVPGAKVEAVNVATGVHYPTQASTNGEYRLNNLPVGIYNITASSPSFAATTVNGF